ncbi:MAG: hypothetical protein KDK38_11195 [Leptospiraceae bacterium]|nr:hypothetical protein [Leptospiraceae bacterium]
MSTEEIPIVNRAVPCCYGYIQNGPRGCNCWHPVYDLEQNKIYDTEQPVINVRKKKCNDCAFKHNSPEYQDDSIYNIRGNFYCHQGMRKIIAWKHENGDIVNHNVNCDDYDPPIKKNIPYTANGSPAKICRGWYSRNKRFLS